MKDLINYFILKDFIIPICIVALFIIVPIIYISITSVINKLFKKNCFDCKYYKLYDVAGCGDGCRYKCNKKDKTDYHSMNDRENYVCCKDYIKVGRAK